MVNKNSDCSELIFIYGLGAFMLRGLQLSDLIKIPSPVILTLSPARMPPLSTKLRLQRAKFAFFGELETDRLAKD